MPLKLRFLLTSACNATCGYCHNEGQAKETKRLSVAQIRNILEALATQGIQADEIVLSGGEPSLHKELGEIAKLCRSHTNMLSLDSHGGLPQQLKAAMPYLDELKLHIDFFDAEKQFASMGIDIAKVEESIRLARQFSGLHLISNHPLNNVSDTTAFILRARELGIDCKVIEMFGQGNSCKFLPVMNWENLGYTRSATGEWVHTADNHRVYTKRCDKEYNPSSTFFIGADGVRNAIDSPVICQVDELTPEWIAASALS